MAERDYPPDPTGEFKPNPGRARAREYGVSSGPPVTIGERVLGWSRVLLTIATAVCRATSARVSWPAAAGATSSSPFFTHWRGRMAENRARSGPR